MAEHDEQENDAEFFQVMTLHGAALYVSGYVLIYLALIPGVAFAHLPMTMAAMATLPLISFMPELGHVLAARALGLKVHAGYVRMVGGVCIMGAPAQVWQSVLLYSAGLLAQLLILVAAALYFIFHGISLGQGSAGVLLVLTAGNALIILYNLVPRTYPGGDMTDGRMLWLAYLHRYKNHPYPHPLPLVLPAEQPHVFEAGTSLLSVPALVPHGFVSGIEILNDRTTPMQFVIDVLMRHLDLEQDKAMRLMADIHNRGGALVPLDRARAEQVAEAIMADAEQAGHSFTCRAVAAGNAASAI